MAIRAAESEPALSELEEKFPEWRRGVAVSKEDAQLDSVLLDLYQESLKGKAAVKVFAEQREIEQPTPNTVTVFLVPEEGENAEDIDTQALEQKGVDIVKSSADVIEASVPLDKLPTLADEVGGVSRVQLPAKPQPLAVQSQGVSLTGVSGYHTHGLTGSGVKVAVVDVGFDDLAAAKAAGDIPADAIGIDCTLASCTASSFASGESESHGVIVAEVVHDMAPGAQLYLIKMGNPLDLKNAKDFAVSNGIKVINHSVGWYGFNFFDGACYATNPVAPGCIADEAAAQGILWVNAVGNEAETAYTASYVDANANGFHDEPISLFAFQGEPIILDLSWDSWPVTNQDYDLYLFTNGGIVVGSGILDQTPGGFEPQEYISTIAPVTGTYVVGVRKFQASANYRFTIHSWYQDVSPAVAAGSLANPADSASVLSVGAINQSAWTGGPAEEFSSQGPNNAGVLKPELMGPDGVLTSSLSRFFGTSAASPHVAGAAALLLSLHPEFSAAQLKSGLIATAVDMGVPGPDTVYGYGRLHLITPSPTPTPTPTLTFTPTPSPTLTPTPEPASSSGNGGGDGGGGGGGGGGGDEPQPTPIPLVKKGKVLGTATAISSMDRRAKDFIVNINVPTVVQRLFTSVFGRSPTVAESTYWKGRARGDKATETKLRGAMLFQKIRGFTMPGRRLRSVSP